MAIVLLPASSPGLVERSITSKVMRMTKGTVVEKAAAEMLTN